jgi:aminoglycoside phosphotransferase (APT) family kinase protein
VFRVPKPLGALRDEGGVILVEAQVTGVPLELRAGKQGKVQPWKVIGEVAAAIHAVPVSELLPSIDCPVYAETLARSVAGDEAELRDACNWMLEHLPPAEPGLLLHGDLLGQNVFLGIDEPVGVIDWERAEAGDPAYDLAIVTRGVRQPFQVANGLERLLDAYAGAGGRPLAP